MPTALEARLRRLRGGTVPPDAPGVDPEPDRPSLADRLGRLRAGAGLGTTAAGSRRGVPDEGRLAETLGAELLAPGVLLVERWIDPRLRHGRRPLGAIGDLAALSLPEVRAPGAAGAPWLGLDTETSGLSGGTGTWAFLAGLLRQTPRGWLLRQILLTRLDAEPAYLERVVAELAPPVRLVTYNGRGFDVPLLVARLRLAARADPFPGLAHLDLLAPTRRAFARTWPDCRLVTAETRLLGLRRSDDLPGAEAPRAWLAWLRGGETAPLARVLRHNRLDLLSLAALLPVLDDVYGDPAAWGADVRAVAAAHAARGDPRRALTLLARERRRLDTRGLHDLARLYRRLGDWARAVEIWEGLESAGDLDARAALARYLEHRARDPQAALALVDGLPPGPDREHRRTRLLGRCARITGRLPLDVGQSGC